jgi:hypothetical protein
MQPFQFANFGAAKFSFFCGAQLPNYINNLTSLCHLDASKVHGTIYVPPGIGQLTNLQTLTTFTVGGVSWNCKLHPLLEEHVLGALKPHPLLEELNINGYYSLKFTSWIADHTLSDLVSMTLDNCYNCAKLPSLGTLPVLRCLFIQNIRGVKVITSEFCATSIISSKSFPKLEILKLCDMYNLEG